MSKMVYLGEWVRARPLMNKKFRSDGPCEKCGRLSCATAWVSIKTGKNRCFRCFDAVSGLPPISETHAGIDRQPSEAGDEDR